MARYFDANDGQVTQRLASFVADEGVLARLLDGYLAPQNSVLAQALARQVGESSPLFKKLSATDSEGLVKVLENQLRGVMQDGHAELVRALESAGAGRRRGPLPQSHCGPVAGRRRRPRQAALDGAGPANRRQRRKSRS